MNLANLQVATNFESAGEHTVIGLLDATNTLIPMSSISEISEHTSFHILTHIDESNIEVIKECSLILYECKSSQIREALSKIRWILSLRPLLPIIAVTDLEDAEVVRTLYSTGVVDCILPSEKSMPLVEKISNLINIGNSNRLIEVQNAELVRTLTEARVLNQELVTEVEARSQAEQALKQAHLDLVRTAKMSTLGETSANIAHELMNPLSIILAKIERTRRQISRGDSITAADFDKRFEDLEKVAHRILKIINTLRTYARGEAKNAFEVCALSQIVEDSLTMIMEKLSSANILLKQKPIRPDLMINCRATEISQVLINLMNNSRQAIKDLPGEKWIEIEVVENSEKIKIMITDCGNGIPEDVAKKIFEPFFTTKSKDEGTGIGLSLSVKFIEEHKGKLELDQEFKNTRFVITLPIARTNS